jgi:hypothetical protein
VSTLTVRESFTCTLPNGDPIVCKPGDLFPEDHPVVRGREHLFVDVASLARSTPASAVERATAGPGERRVTTRPLSRPVTGSPSSK